VKNDSERHDALIQNLRDRFAGAILDVDRSFGDCAVTGNVPAMRNNFGASAVLRRAYIENTASDPQIPREVIPQLLPETRPVHEAVPVDIFVPGCPPPAGLIFSVLSELLEGKTPNAAAKFG